MGYLRLMNPFGMRMAAMFMRDLHDRALHGSPLALGIVRGLRAWLVLLLVVTDLAWIRRFSPFGSFW